MPTVTRSSDVVEAYGERALIFGLSGLAAAVLGGLLLKYQSMIALAWILLPGGIVAIGYAIYVASQIKSVSGTTVTCPYCHAKNSFTEQPTSDVRCNECNRQMPIVNGVLLRVSQVRCGFCNTLNYYSEKSVGLICENCDREIPIANESGATINRAATNYAFKEDKKHYDIVLTATGHKNEQLINYLQHLLALNRNQVKQMLAELPCTLLTGVTHLKAEMVQKELAKCEGVSEIPESNA
jgi:ribosomal protein L7/L12